MPPCFLRYPRPRVRKTPPEAESSPPERQRIELEVGFDTTYFDGPLREDGTVDYIAALNEKYSEGVTLENNAFVELLLLAPADRRGEQDAEVMQALGLPREREDEGACFVTWEAYALEQGIEDYQETRYYLREDNTVTPEGEAWLAVNRVALDRMVEATRRERYFAPIVAEQGGAEADNLFSALLPHLMADRSYARALQARAYARAHAGDGVGAVEDILAIRRYAAMISYGRSLVGNLVSFSIEKLGLEAACQVLASGHFDAEHIKMFVTHWDDRVARVTVVEIVDIRERSATLEILQQMWSGKIFDHDLDWMGVSLISLRFDVNRSLRIVNQDYSMMSHIMQVEDCQRFMRLHDQWVEEWEARHLVAQQAEWEQFKFFVRATLTRDEYTDALTSMVTYITVPNLEGIRKSEMRIDAFNHVVFVALQCERYHLATGTIPPSLEALVPEYLSEVPRDPIDGEPLRYLVTDTKYTVYSIGTDLEDDGGVDDHGEGDIAVVVGLAAE